MDRRLRGQKLPARRRLYGRTPPGLRRKRPMAVKTEHGDGRGPGFTEIDRVAHAGHSGAGEFGHTLNVTDIHRGWTESRALLGRSQLAVLTAIHEVEPALPFALRGLDCDKGSEFINGNWRAGCQGQNIQRTRGRPYQKDDHAHVEPKNGTHGRKLRGGDRYDAVAAIEAINDRYRQELRGLRNLCLPSVKLVKKTRGGSKLRRVYDAPQTPLPRVAPSGDAEPGRLAELMKLQSRLDPFELARRMDRKLKRIYAVANHRLSPGNCPLHADHRKWLRPAEGWVKDAPGKSPKAAFPPSLEIPPRARDSHFPTPPAAGPR